MIHDATVEVTCDGDGCSDCVQVSLDYVYSGYNGTGGRYDTKDEHIEDTLIKEHEWIVRDGKHYCCVYCQPTT